MALAIFSIALLSLGETCHLKGRDMETVWQMVRLLSRYEWIVTARISIMTSRGLIATQNNRDLHQAIFRLWSKFGDPSLNG